MILHRPLVPTRRLSLPARSARPIGLSADRVASFLLHRNAVRPEEVPAPAGSEQDKERDGAAGRGRQDR